MVPCGRPTGMLWLDRVYKEAVDDREWQEALDPEDRAPEALDPEVSAPRPNAKGSRCAGPDRSR